MNRFILSVNPPNSPDRFVYPLETELSGGDLFYEMQKFFYNVAEEPGMDFDRCGHFLDLGGTGVMLNFQQVSCLVLTGIRTYETVFSPPDLLTVDQWFAQK